MLESIVMIVALIHFSKVKGVFKVYDEVDDTPDRVVTHNELNKLWSNSVCCKKNLRCCKKEEDVQIRAVLKNCIEENEMMSFYEKIMKVEAMPLRGFYNGEPLSNSSIKQCRKKLLLSIKMNTPSNRNKINNQFLIDDYVVDPGTHQNVKILTPYVIKFRQSVVSQMYKLDFLHVINSNAAEEVFNKHSGNYTGCNTRSAAPTCGKVSNNGNNVPYSEGFCCSCDDKVNAQRQPDSPKEYVDDIVTYSNPEFLLNGNECPRYLRARETNQDFDSQSHFWYQYVNPNVKKIARSAHRTYSNSFKVPHLYKDAKRQIQVNGEQERGWQNCIDKDTPRDVDPETFHESAHCLKFSNVWYTVYGLHRPQLEHSVLMQVFERHEDTSGRVIWKDLTNGRMVRIGTLTNTYEDKNKIVIKYSSKLRYVHHTAFAINHKNALFLVPDGVTKEEYRNHPEVRNGPSEYLVVHNNQIRSSGDRCNVGGVGFEAFAKQPSRCSRPRGTCLSNQPYNLWLHDHQAENEGKKGCFFLKNYGTFPPNPIRRDPRTREQYLVMDFHDVEPIGINLEIRADFNTILSHLGPAKITEVYIDSTYSYKTVITIKITNAGLVSGFFSTRLQNCPLQIPASFSNIESIPKLIPLNINIFLIWKSRRILVQTFDRCFCTWHCLCTCVGSNEGLKCKPMSLEQYHAAGFRGSLPITVLDVKYTFLDEIMTFVIYLFVYILLVLLLLGLIKGILGAFFNLRKIGMFGLDVILDLPQPIPRYYENDLYRLEVIYDCEGWPIHPRTGARVRSIKQSTELCTNVLFFFIFPVYLCLFTYRKLRNKILNHNFDSDYKKAKCYCICDCNYRDDDLSNTHGDSTFKDTCRFRSIKGKAETEQENRNTLPPNACKCICKCKHEGHSNFKFLKKNKLSSNYMIKLDELSEDGSCKCPKQIAVSYGPNEDGISSSTVSKHSFRRSDSSFKEEHDRSRANTNSTIVEQSNEDKVANEKNVVDENPNRPTFSLTQIDVRDDSTNEIIDPSYDSSWTDQTDEYEIDH
ncbi:hypothetical protein FQR65_LT05889 [Abscondita terminalis]|nr:hypothetical protein FQR65_LT05889 [Abscondita terminalis]